MRQCSHSLVKGCSLWSKRLRNRAAALTSQNHMTNNFHMAKEQGVQWQLNRSYSLTCTPGHVAAQCNCATVTVDTVILGNFQAACVSKITVELTTFLPCNLMSETEYNRECCGCFTACDVKHSHTIQLTNSQVILWNIMQHWNLVDQVNSAGPTAKGWTKFWPTVIAIYDWRVYGIAPLPPYGLISRS